jgi:hypothetical protein
VGTGREGRRSNPDLVWQHIRELHTERFRRRGHVPVWWQRIVTLLEQRGMAQDIWPVRSSGVRQFCSYRGSIRVMATQKRSISFDESVLREAELRIAESGGNLSAFVNTALLHELQVARGRELLAEDDAEFGAVPAEVETQVLAEWPA